MKIYFAGSIRGGRADVETYLEMINYLKKYGEVLTEHIGDKKISVFGEVKFNSKYIHDRDIEWILQADVVIAEVSSPSLGVGYEIAKAIDFGKRVLCLYRPQEGKRLSAMIGGCSSLTNKEYNNLEEAKKSIDDFFVNL